MCSFWSNLRRTEVSEISSSYTFCKDWWYHWAEKPNKSFISSASQRIFCLVKRPLERIRAQICHFEHSHFPLGRTICKIKCKGIYLIVHHYLDFVPISLIISGITVTSCCSITVKQTTLLITSPAAFSNLYIEHTLEGFVCVFRHAWVSESYLWSNRWFG